MSKLNEPKMDEGVALRTRPEQWKALFSSIGNKKFRATYPKLFRVYSDNTTDAESVAYLACWAETGMGSKRWALAVRQIFDVLLPFSYIEYEAQGYLKIARRIRYRKSKPFVNGSLIVG
jgi:hypothetical protein